MLLLLGVVVGVIAGLIRWHGPAYLAQLRLRLAPLFVIAFLVQFAAVLFVPASDSGPDWRGISFLTGYLLVLVGVVLNWRLWPVRLLGLGFALNLLAILPHGGYMPITVEAYAAAGLARPDDTLTEGTKLARAKDVVLVREHTAFWPLSDVIPIGEPRLLRGVYSPGDLIIALAAALLGSGCGLSAREALNARNRGEERVAFRTVE